MSGGQGPGNGGDGPAGGGQGPVGGGQGPAGGGQGPVGGGQGPADGSQGGVPGDRITLRGLRARGYHGVFEHERRDGQEFVIDAVLWTDTTVAAEGDDLAGTADYGALAGRLMAVVTGEPVSLIETLASRLAAACLADPAVREAEITVHKPQAPIPFPFDDVAVTIRRGRV
jgi:7,8-dihydroneopterin aldolase/epimerase/oxygenase